MSALAQTGTFSKAPSAWGLPDDLVVFGQAGAHVFLGDARDANPYLDWTSSLGASFFGHTDEFIDVVARQVGRGVCATLPWDLEAETAIKLSDLLGDYVPGWNPADVFVRFAKTGTDATTMAVRLARTVTGNELVLSCGYHGWASWSVAKTLPAFGCLISEALTTCDIKFGERGLNDRVPRQNGIACVVVENPAEDPPEDWYAYLRRFCDERGALLVMDEIVTWPRYGLGGASERYGVRPDLVCLGKALGNGLAVSALAGPWGLMKRFRGDEPVFCSSTTWGNALGLAAAVWVLDNLNNFKIKRNWSRGLDLVDGLRGAGWDVFGHGARSVLRFEDPLERAFFIQGMFKRGVLMNRPNFPNLAMTRDDVTHTLSAAAEVRHEFERSDRDELVEATEGRLPRVLFGER